MDILNKNQKQILKLLNVNITDYIIGIDLISKMGVNEDDIFPDLLILSHKEYVELLPLSFRIFPIRLKITPQGIEKLQENWYTIFKENVYFNPLSVAALIISTISILIVCFGN